MTATDADWQELRRRHVVRISIGVHFGGWNRGFGLSGDVLATVARLGLDIDFDLYAYDD